MSCCCRQRSTVCEHRQSQSTTVEGVSLNMTDIYQCLIQSRSPHSNTDGVRMPSTTFDGVRTLLESSTVRFLDYPHGGTSLECRRRHSTVWPPAIAVDGVSLNATEIYQYWNLSMLDFWYHPIPRIRTPSTAFECPRRPWTAFQHARRRQWERYIYLGLSTIGLLVYTVHAIFCAVQYHIHRFPPRLYRAITKH